MSKALSVKVKQRKNKAGQDAWTGTVELPGVKPTKVVRRSDRSTDFGTRSAVVASARSFAKKYGFDGVDTGEQVAKAAKTKTRTTKK